MKSKREEINKDFVLRFVKYYCKPKIPIQAFIKTNIEVLVAKVLITRQYLY